MGASTIDEIRAGLIALYTRSLNAADTAAADEMLAATAPDLTAGTATLQGRRAGNETQPRRGQGPPGTRQAERAAAGGPLAPSGNASLAGREMDTADAMASKAYLDAVAARLRAGGLAWPARRATGIGQTDPPRAATL